MTSRVDWHGDEWMRKVLEPAARHGLDRSSIVLQTEMRKRMGTEGGGVLRKANKRRAVFVGGKKIGGAYFKNGKFLDKKGKPIEGASFGMEDLTSAVQGPAQPGKRAVKGRGRNVYYPAPPGSFPGVRTGTLRRAILWWIPNNRRNELISLVGVPGGLKKGKTTVGKYARFLEEGTGKMAARPWAERSMGLAKDRMVREFTRSASRHIRQNAQGAA